MSSKFRSYLYILPVADLQNKNDQPVFLHVKNYPVIANPEPVTPHPDKFLLDKSAELKNQLTQQQPCTS